MKVGAIILAAGSGTRLNNGLPSEKPKVLYEIDARPMVEHTLELLDELGVEEKIMVVGYKEEMIKEYFGSRVKYASQPERQGTAHAAKLGEGLLSERVSQLLIIQGDDSAFYKSVTIKNFIEEATDLKVAFTTVVLEDPGAYGRVIRNEAGEVSAIVEKEEATSEQMKINEVNAATYLIERAWFNQNYLSLQPSKVGKGEIIMPDLIKLAFAQNEKVLGFEVPKEEWVGVNTPEELERANQLMKGQQSG